MANPELAIYIVTAAFWASFGVTRLVLRSRESKTAAPPAPAASASKEATAPYSRARARAEEGLLKRAFGQAYLDYMAHTRRFVPGIY